MNASSALRGSIYGLNGLSGSLGLPTGLSPRPRPRRRPEAGTADEIPEPASRRRTFVPLDWKSYAEECRGEKEAYYPKSTLTISYVHGPPGVWRQVGRMFTIFPVRDANWLIAMLFVIGSISFEINALFGLLSSLNPELVFPNETELAIPLTNLGGAGLFVTGSILSIPAAWNADRGVLEPVEYRQDDDGPIKTYRPALLGSDAWLWVPTSKDFAAAMTTLPFQITLVQFLGGAILSISVVGGWPGVISPDNLLGSQLFLFAPLTVGGSLFFFSNLILLVWLQKRWFSPEPSTAAWQAAFWSTLGSLNFALIGISLFLNDLMGSSLAGFIGSTAFLLGSIIQWYDVMAFHPDSWAT